MTTCPNATAPVNIVNNPNAICDLKCDYGFKYPLQPSLKLVHAKDYLSLKTEPANTPPVVYNANKYDVSEMRLYQPSLHTYNGKKAEAELIIIHNGVATQGTLLVCVPITSGWSSGNPDSSTIFDKIISEVAKTANSISTETAVNIPTFSIDKFIPLKPYYSYTGTLPYSPCNSECDYVVFSKEHDATLAISAKAYATLRKLITNNGYSTMKNRNGVFYNKTGPSSLSGGSTKGDIFMECLPTGSEGESLVPLEKNTEQMFNTESIKDFFTANSWIVNILLGLIIILVLLKIGGFLVKKFRMDKVSTAVAAATTTVTGGAKAISGITKRFRSKANK